MVLSALQLAQDQELGKMTTLRTERNHGDLERFARGLKSGEFYVSDFDPALIQELRNHLEGVMPANNQTPENPECSCPSAAAIAAGFDVPHAVHCYISLAKDAEAVQGVPVRDLAQHTYNTEGRKNYTNNGLATGNFPPKLTFSIAPPDLIVSIRLDGSNNAINTTLIPAEYDTENQATKYEAPAARFRLDAKDEAQGHDGPFPVFHVTLINQDAAFNGKAMDISTGGANLVGPLATMPLGQTFDVVRTPNTTGGRANWYEIYQVD